MIVTTGGAMPFTVKDALASVLGWAIEGDETCRMARYVPGEYAEVEAVALPVAVPFMGTVAVLLKLCTDAWVVGFTIRTCMERLAISALPLFAML